MKDTLSRIVQWAHLYVTKVKEPVITESLFRIVKSLYGMFPCTALLHHRNGF